MTKGVARITNNRRLTFKFASDESASTFECRIDAKAFRSCASAKTVRVSLGRHKFRVRAIDAAGNIDSTPASDRFRVVR